MLKEQKKTDNEEIVFNRDTDSLCGYGFGATDVYAMYRTSIRLQGLFDTEANRRHS